MFKMPTLPYGLDGLEPYISEKTLSYHYGKHHKAYVDNLNKFVEASASVSYKGMSVEQIVAGSEGGLFNNVCGPTAPAVTTYQVMNSLKS